MKHVSIRVFGRVQGVCFRAYAQDMAESLGLAGFVKNMPDRSVYMEAEGIEENVKEFVDWARRGPPAAKVTDIQVNFSDYLRKFDGFEIRYW
jgi:acylphosphatase